jgi:heterodisulfide reductase subunit B
MKKYAYFPGCSLEKMGLSYHMSAVETTRRLGVELQELEDWNCCGATAYFHVDELLAYTLCARNLAQAERAHLDVVDLRGDPDLAEHINFALEEDDLQLSGPVAVRHLLEVFVQDIGLAELKAKASHPLKGLRVAPYYGCQILRPRKDHENVEQPQFFEDLLSAVGAEPVDFALKLACCGGALIISNRPAALSLVRNLLQSAIQAGATVIATACPLCQVNLECYQQQVNREFGTELSIPIMYFTQIVGLAMGIAPDSLGIGRELVLPTPALACART